MERRADGVWARGVGGGGVLASLHLAGAGERAAGEGGGGGIRKEVDGAGGEGRGGDRVGDGGGAAGRGAGGEGGRAAAHGGDGRVLGDGHEEGAAAGAVRAVAIVAGGDGVAACLHRARGVGHRAARRGSAATQCAAVTWGEGPTAAGREGDHACRGNGRARARVRDCRRAVSRLTHGDRRRRAGHAGRRGSGVHLMRLARRGARVEVAVTAVLGGQCLRPRRRGGQRAAARGHGCGAAGARAVVYGDRSGWRTTAGVFGRDRPGDGVGLSRDGGVGRVRGDLCGRVVLHDDRVRQRQGSTRVLTTRVVAGRDEGNAVRPGQGGRRNVEALREGTGGIMVSMIDADNPPRANWPAGGPPTSRDPGSSGLYLYRGGDRRAG